MEAGLTGMWAVKLLGGPIRALYSRCMEVICGDAELQKTSLKVLADQKIDTLQANDGHIN